MTDKFNVGDKVINKETGVPGLKVGAKGKVVGIEEATLDVEFKGFTQGHEGFSEDIRTRNLRFYWEGEGTRILNEAVEIGLVTPGDAARMFQRIQEIGCVVAREVDVAGGK